MNVFAAPWWDNVTDDALVLVAFVLFVAIYAYARVLRARTWR